MTAARDAYYADKTATLSDLFGTADLRVFESWLEVGGRRYPIVGDVIVLLHPSQYPSELSGLRTGDPEEGPAPPAWDPGVQFTFGAQWNLYREILPEHRAEFERYFDLVDLAALADRRLCDLGCGNGRWSVFLERYCREIVLVDLSMAIFAARQNLGSSSRGLFFMGDLQALPFREGFADFVVCLGALHHLPTDALQAVRGLARYGRRGLVYLYYALDNRPWHYRLLFRGADAVRRRLARVRRSGLRAAITVAIAALVYEPLVWIGRLFAFFGLGRLIPLYEIYRDSGWRRICQDAYDRFFTPIEQRVSRREILGLTDSFERIVVSDGLPYWHFLFETGSGGTGS